MNRRHPYTAFIDSVEFDDFLEGVIDQVILGLEADEVAEEEISDLFKSSSKSQKPVLRRGSKGSTVAELQRRLFNIGFSVKFDGIFGPKTDTAVRAFQRSQNLRSDGIVGPNTWSALLRSSGVSPSLPIFPTSSVADIISRDQWGARSPKCASSWEQCGKRNLRLPVEQVFIHHTTGRMPELPEEESVMKSLQNLAMNNQNKADISYNFVVMPSGRIFEGRGWNVVAYATPKNNLKSLSFCFAGNYQKNNPTLASLKGCRRALDAGMRAGYLMPNFSIKGHRDVSATACPGKYLYAQLGALNPRS